MFKPQTVEGIMSDFHKLICDLQDHAEVSANKADFHMEQHQIHNTEAMKAFSISQKMRNLINA